MNRKYLILFLLLAFCSVTQADWTEKIQLWASDPNTQDEFGHAVSISGYDIVVGVPNKNVNGSYSGAAYIYKFCSDPNWCIEQKITSSDNDNNDEFGHSVSIRDDRLIVGAPSEQNDGNNVSGAAYIFERDNSNWIEKDKLVAQVRDALDEFGWSVSICGDLAIVGAPRDDDLGNDAGAAYIFAPNDVDPNQWDFMTKLLASDGGVMDEFGEAVAIDGNFAIVGAPWDGGGSAYIFHTSDGNNWSEICKLIPSGGGEFGDSVSISGSYAIIGAPAESPNGAAYIFTPNDVNPNIWDEQARLLASDGATADQFGASVSIDGDLAVVGAPHHVMDETGTAYIFKRENTNWIEAAKLTRTGGNAGDNFGYSVGISGSYVIVGVPDDDDKGNNTGSAYLYERVCPQGDLSGDCIVTFIDFGIMAGEWLQSN